jgi:ABC-2 type transport system permease protein
VSVEARTRLSYRVDFWIDAAVGFLANFGLMYFLWAAMFRESGETRIGGYDFNGILFYYVAVILFGKIVRGPELQGAVSTDIYEGGLNRYLVFPTRYFAFKYAQNLGTLVAPFVQLVLFGVWFVLFLDTPSTGGITPLTVLMGLVSVLAANLLYFVMRFPLQCVAFWTDNVWSLSVALRFFAALLGGAMLPLSVFPIWARSGLDWLPFRFLYDFPVNVTLGRVSFTEWIAGLALALVWTAVIGWAARAVWRRGVYQYSGVGI